MNTKVKYAAAAAIVGALALAAANPADARWRVGAAAAAAGGFVAGAAIGAAAASGPYYYGPGYAYDYGYYGGPYAYDYGYDSYAYEPAYTGPSYGYRWSRDAHRDCLSSPGSQNNRECQ